MANLYRPEFEPDDRPPGFGSRRARLGDELGCERIGASVWEVPPGEAAYPYHFHHADEELVIVVRGRPTLRTPDGERELEEGEAVRFPVGEEGAHQLRNDTSVDVTLLAVSSSGGPEVVVYPDSDKIGVRGGGLRAFFPRSAAVDYWSGEGGSPPPG